MKLTRPAPLALIVAIVATAAFAAWRVLAAREPAPAVSYTLLDGSKASSETLRGKVLLVNFWATSCTTCVAEMPQIVATHEKFKSRGYETVAVAMSYDPPAYVARFAETRKLPFGVAIDNTGAIAKSFGDVQMTPTTFRSTSRVGWSSVISARRTSRRCTR
jgi:peroxiredoxin